MALTELIFPRQKAQIGIIQFDASVSETHTSASEVTDHPVEEGSTITDHIRKLPKTIEINGIVTNTPLVFLATFFAESPLTVDLNPTDSRVESAYSELERIQEEGEVVDVVTSFREYSNMAITNVSVTRDKSTGNVLDCTVSLREILFARALTLDLPIPKNVANKAAKNKGKKPKTESTAKQGAEADSMLSSVKKGITGIFG